MHTDACKPRVRRHCVHTARYVRLMFRYACCQLRRSSRCLLILPFVLVAVLLISLQVASNALISRNISIPSLLDTGYAPRWSLYTDCPSQALRRFTVIVVLPPFTAAYNATSLRHLLQSVRDANYSGKTVALELLLAPGRDPHEFRERYLIAKRQEWPHGRRQVMNVTSGGLYEMGVDAWRPLRSSLERVVIIDAKHAKPLNANYYAYINSVYNRYQPFAPSIAGYAIEPVSIRKLRSSTSIRASSDWKPPVSTNEEDVYLYQGLPYVPVFAPANSESWRRFQNWFAAHKQEWFLWPEVVKPKNRMDKAWNGFRGTRRAHWTLWYARFCAEHQLYVVYPKKSPAEPLPSTVVPSSTKLLKVNYAGTVVTEEMERGPHGASSSELDSIVELGRKQGGSVSLTIVNEAFLDTARSWICNVDVAGLRPPGVVWITTDETSYEALKKIEGTKAIHMKSFRGGRSQTGTSFNTPGYWLLMLERTRLILDILDRGTGVFAFETDQIWLRDPVPVVRRLLQSGDGVDLVGTVDTRNQIGGNFLYFAPTLATRKLWREVYKRFSAAYYGAHLHRHTAKYGKYIENDQSIMTNLVFYDKAFHSRYPIVFRALDTNRFVDGRWYTGRFYGPEAKSPTMINNNFLVGIEEKRKRAIQFGHWFYDEKAGRCNRDAVLHAVEKNRKNEDPKTNADTVGEVDIGLDTGLSAIDKALKR